MIVLETGSSCIWQTGNILYLLRRLALVSLFFSFFCASPMPKNGRVRIVGILIMGLFCSFCPVWVAIIFATFGYVWGTTTKKQWSDSERKKIKNKQKKIRKNGTKINRQRNDKNKTKHFWQKKQARDTSFALLCLLIRTGLILVCTTCSGRYLLIPSLFGFSISGCGRLHEFHRFFLFLSFPLLENSEVYTITSRGVDVLWLLCPVSQNVMLCCPI